MTFALLHEALRVEILRRIDRGVLTGKLLARQTGLGQAHISNFLHRRRMLSLDGLDKVLLSQGLSVEVLVRSSPGPLSAYPARPAPDVVPLVSQATAVHDRFILPVAVVDEVHLPPGTLDRMRPRCVPARRAWQRFVAVRLTAQQARAMKPVLGANSIVVLDRHYNSMAPYKAGSPTLFAVSVGGGLSLRYVTVEGDRLLLRPYSLNHPVELVVIEAQRTASDYIVGRAVLTMAEV